LAVPRSKRRTAVAPRSRLAEFSTPAAARPPGRTVPATLSTPSLPLPLSTAPAATSQVLAGATLPLTRNWPATTEMAPV